MYPVHLLSFHALESPCFYLDNHLMKQPKRLYHTCTWVFECLSVYVHVYDKPVVERIPWQYKKYMPLFDWLKKSCSIICDA